jgi:peptidoglycan L-alanyl-D-glutamate endopeptidase CwlK
MGYSFGEKSLKNLETCHKDIQTILYEIIKYYDFSVISGIRTTEEQQELFMLGKSKLDGINQKSKHQGRPDEDGNIVSFAVDIMPYKKGTNAFSGHEKDDRRFYMLMGMVKATAQRLKDEGEISHSVRFGLDWDGDDTFRDQAFDDLPHLELV